MSRPSARAIAASLVAACLVGGTSCEPIQPRPLSDAPRNTCPCDRYEAGATTAAHCSSSGRCEILTAGGRPEYPFWIVVHVPDSSIFAPGMTFVLYSDAQGNPAFKPPAARPGAFVRCLPPLCLPLGGLVSASGAYRVSAEASAYVGYPLEEGASIPVRVVYEPLGNEQQETFPRLPLDVLLSSSSRIDKSGSAAFGRALPVGRYRRIFLPERPFDELFPPRLDVQGIGSDFFEDFTLGGGTGIDDMGGTSRMARVMREAGLDGWRVWLVDRASQRRISVVRSLSGIEAKVELYTTGESRTPQGGLGDDVEAVVAPPPGFRAVPRYVTRLFGGAGLQSLEVPSTPPPVSVAGVVAEPTNGPGDPLFGYAAQVSFESQEIATDTGTSTLLRYATSVSTDDRGRFATVLPPGVYAATISPAEGTGYAVRREVVVADRALTAVIFQPPPRTRVLGRAVVTDGRALSDAEVIAIPGSATTAGPLTATPRPGRTRTGDDGRFALDLDPGPYVVSVIPRGGTGFPRVVVRPEIPGSATGQSTELPDVRVPAPTRLAFTLRDPSPTGNPIANAVVRIFATPAPGTTSSGIALDPVEIGNAMTDAEGAVEILLAQEPR
jgi:hypothetical protein